MNEGRRRLNVIHQSLVRPVLLAGAERPLAIANWITAAALILGAGQWYTAVLGVLLATAGHWAAGAGREDRSGTEPGLHPPHSLSHRTAIRRALRSGRRRPPRIRPTVPTAARDAGMRREKGMFFKEFRDLRRKPDRRLGLPDLLNFAFAEDDYTIVIKDGARLVAFECTGRI